MGTHEEELDPEVLAYISEIEITCSYWYVYTTPMQTTQ